MRENGKRERERDCLPEEGVGSGWGLSLNGTGTQVTSFTCF